MFKLAAPSYIFPGTIWENISYLNAKVDEVGLLFFETRACLDYGSQDLPPQLKKFDLSFHVHLPLDLPWQAGAEQVARIILELADKVNFLDVSQFVLHPPDTPKELQIITEAWIKAGFSPKSLLLENIRSNDLLQLWPCIQDLQLGLCLDIGHLFTYNQTSLLQLPNVLNQVDMLHIYGAERAMRHRGLEEMTEKQWTIFEDILKNIGPNTVLMIELFNKQDFKKSQKLLLSSLQKMGLRE